MGYRINKNSKIFITFLEENIGNYHHNLVEGKYLRGQRIIKENNDINWISSELKICAY